MRKAASRGAPFFTVVIPIYNRAAELRTAIESVRAQTFQDFEIIVVDDGSRDDPEAVVGAFRDPRLHVIHQRSAGGGAARNRGIDAVRGPFVAFLDSDDVYLPHHLGSMHTLLKDTRDIAGYARVWVDRGQGPVFLKPPRAIRLAEDMAIYLLCDRGFTQTSTMVVPRERRKKYASTNICVRRKIRIPPSACILPDAASACSRRPVRYGTIVMTRPVLPPMPASSSRAPGWKR